jgi:FKBP-type peptidyl-prolyl cis-trans isomerase
MSFSERAQSILNQKCVSCEKGLHEKCLRRNSDLCCCGVEPRLQVTPSSSVEHPEDEKQEEERTKQEEARTKQEVAKTKQEEEKTKQEEAKAKQEDAKTRQEEERTKQVVEEGKLSVPVRLSRSDSEEIDRMASFSVVKKTNGPKRKRERKS